MSLFQHLMMGSPVNTSTTLEELIMIKLVTGRRAGTKYSFRLDSFPEDCVFSRFFEQLENVLLELPANLRLDVTLPRLEEIDADVIPPLVSLLSRIPPCVGSFTFHLGEFRVMGSKQRLELHHQQNTGELDDLEILQPLAPLLYRLHMACLFFEQDNYLQSFIDLMKKDSFVNFGYQALINPCLSTLTTNPQGPRIVIDLFTDINLTYAVPCPGARTLDMTHLRTSTPKELVNRIFTVLYPNVDAVIVKDDFSFGESSVDYVNAILSDLPRTVKLLKFDSDTTSPVQAKWTEFFAHRQTETFGPAALFGKQIIDNTLTLFVHPRLVCFHHQDDEDDVDREAKHVRVE